VGGAGAVEVCGSDQQASLAISSSRAVPVLYRSSRSVAASSQARWEISQQAAGSRRQPGAQPHTICVTGAATAVSRDILYQYPTSRIHIRTQIIRVPGT